MFDQEGKAILKLTNKAPKVGMYLGTTPSPKAIFSHVLKKTNTETRLLREPLEVLVSQSFLLNKPDNWVGASLAIRPAACENITLILSFDKGTLAMELHNKKGSVAVVFVTI